DHAHFGETEPLRQLERRTQVAEMHRVERTAEYADQPVRNRLGGRGRHAWRIRGEGRDGCRMPSRSFVSASHGGMPGAPLTMPSTSTASFSKRRSESRSKRDNAFCTRGRLRGQTR